VAYRLVETMGVIPRPEVAKDVKALDQEGRALLRKHGVRFGQHTVFMPALLKPAPARLRLALWALSEGFEEFPAPPPPGMVTIPAVQGAPSGFYPRAGYRLAGGRAIRIDMLERLADMIRSEDVRAGFEATADMLSITGCTLEQFAELMKGLGWQVEKDERPKPAAATAPKTPDTAEAPGDAEAPTAEAAAEPPSDAGDAPTAAHEASDAAVEPVAASAAPGRDEPAAGGEAARGDGGEAGAADQAATVEGAATEAGPTDDGKAADELATGETAAADESAATEEPATGETVVYYRFTWAPRSRPARGAPRRDGRSSGGEAAAGGAARPGPKGDGRGPRKGKGGPPPKGKGKGGKPPREEGPRRFSAGPDRGRRDEVDPDSPFAALMALKSKK
ncbi:MAG: disulfide oxidoreductase, partial [Paracoccaceae bacterium]